jgi:hypothetical protein
VSRAARTTREPSPAAVGDRLPVRRGLGLRIGGRNPIDGAAVDGVAEQLDQRGAAGRHTRGER